MPDKYKYYQEQLASLDTTDRLRIKIQGSKERNETKWMALNKESVKDLIVFLTQLETLDE